MGQQWKEIEFKYICGDELEKVIDNNSHTYQKLENIVKKTPKLLFSPLGVRRNFKSTRLWQIWFPFLFRWTILMFPNSFIKEPQRLHAKPRQNRPPPFWLCTYNLKPRTCIELTIESLLTLKIHLNICPWNYTKRNGKSPRIIPQEGLIKTVARNLGQLLSGNVDKTKLDGPMVWLGSRHIYMFFSWKELENVCSR